MSDWIDVAKADEIAPGAYRVVDVDDLMIAVINVAGAFYAIQDVCTHDGSELTGGDIEGEEIICPRHGARFNIKNGAVLEGPAYEDVPTFPVRIQDGMIQVKAEYL